MTKRVLLLFVFVLAIVSATEAQVPMNVGVQILQAEDARRYDKTLEDLIKSPNLAIRNRAALAAGRIGDDRALPALIELLNNEAAVNTAAMAAFAIGEIESIKGADAILKTLADPKTPHQVMARAAEAAGKIAAANAKEERSKALGAAILRVLNSELNTQRSPNTDVIRLGLTAVLRAHPAGAEDTVRKFLAFTDPNIVADALNTLARSRAKNANRDARDLLTTSPNAVVRANAARVLGAAEDKDAADFLLDVVTKDSEDIRVRVSAMRALATIKDPKVLSRLFLQGHYLLGSDIAHRVDRPEKNEALELATLFGRLLERSDNADAVKYLNAAARWGSNHDPETFIALARVSPTAFQKTLTELTTKEKSDWRSVSAIAQGLGELSGLPITGDGASNRKVALDQLSAGLSGFLEGQSPNVNAKATPDIMRSLARFKPETLEADLRTALANQDVFVRATAAELLAENFPSQTIRIALEIAFKKSITTDKHDNDAQLAMLDAMAKINKSAALDTIYTALEVPDYLVRKKAFELLDDQDLLNKYPGVVNVVRDARARHKDSVLPYDPKTGTKLGQVLNTDADYRRALSRKNGKVKAVVTTEKGAFTIDLLPEDAPLTVDNFIKLARSNYFNGLEVHRVVPNFVVQDGDPRGDGNGGPGWSIRCEINVVPYERGAVGMALSGKDTGGSQWFVAHSPQPHLDGGYTVFGQVNETGMKVVDQIVRGDKILSIRIVEMGSSSKQKRP
jgi:cyclophilin family peptidyl-prolyl cis-trans isomerase/HEAT repeat protein